jgi:hypothetical protein
MHQGQKLGGRTALLQTQGVVKRGSEKEWTWGGGGRTLGRRVDVNIRQGTQGQHHRHYAVGEGLWEAGHDGGIGALPKEGEKEAVTKAKNHQQDQSTRPVVAGAWAPASMDEMQHLQFH